MNWKFWQSMNSGPRPVPREFADVVISRMRASDPGFDRLMMVEDRGKFANRTVRYFRVYDPDRLGPMTGPITYKALASKKDAVIFEGHSEANHGIVVYDRRPASRHVDQRSV